MNKKALNIEGGACQTESGRRTGFDLNDLVCSNRPSRTLHDSKCQ